MHKTVSQSKTSCLNYRMLHALYNLSARERKKKTFVVWANHKLPFHKIMSLWIMLACQHFISYHCFGLLCNLWCTSLTSIFWSILYKSELSTLKNVPLESQLKQDHCSNFLWKKECCFGISQENGADLSTDWQFMAGWKLA